jgi:hypothetical protein
MSTGVLLYALAGLTARSSDSGTLALCISTARLPTLLPSNSRSRSPSATAEIHPPGRRVVAGGVHFFSVPSKTKSNAQPSAGKDIESSQPARQHDRIVIGHIEHTTTGSHQPRRPMVACSLPDILKSSANTFERFASTVGHSFNLCHQRFTLCTRLAKVLLLETPI